MRHGTRSGLAPSEMLIILLVAVGLAFGFYHYVNARTENAKRELTIRRMLAIEDALRKYCADCAGGLPTQKQTLTALCKRPTAQPVWRGWNGPYLPDTAALKDGWGRDFKYIIPGQPYEGSGVLRPFDLASYGRDGCEGGVGLDADITSWDRRTMEP